MNIHFHHFSRHFFSLVSVHAPTYGLLVRIYLFIAPSMLPSNCLSVQHISLKSVHFTAPSYRLTASPLLRFILVYTPFVILVPSLCLHQLFHVSSNFLHTMLLFPLLVSPSSGTIFAQALYTTDTCEIYLTLAGSLLGAKSRVRG